MTRRLLPWLLAIVGLVCTGAVLALADAATEHDGPAASDPSITSEMVAHRDQALTTLAQGASLVGSEASVAVLTVLVMVVLVVAHRRGTAVRVAVAMGGAAALVVGIKHLVLRARPGSVDVLGPVDHGYSFPSGHTLLSSVFVAVVVALLWRRLHSPAARVVAVVSAVLVALLVGASRVYLGYHWATDVAASWLVATAWCSLLALVLLLVPRGQLVASRDDRRAGAAAITAARR